FSAAHRARIRRAPLAGHVPDSVSVWDAVNARQKSIEHLFGMALACSYDEERLRAAMLEAAAKKDAAALREIRQRARDTFSRLHCNELMRRMARFEVWQTPTLTAATRMDLRDAKAIGGAPELPLVPEPIRAAWKGPREQTAASGSEELEAL